MAAERAPGLSTSRGAWASALAVASALLAFSAFEYVMPAKVKSPWIVNELGAAQFRELLHLAVQPVDPLAFRRGFLVALAVMAAAYLALLAQAISGRTLDVPRARRLATALVLAVAVLAPPALSCDVYAYVGYARLAVVHHLDPYVATQKTLRELGDVTAPFLRWPIASPYGPLWTILCIAVEWPLQHAPLAAQVIALKLVGGAAVLALAEGARRLAEHVAPGTGPRTYFALALSPFLLVEGVASAHNDVVMMAGVMWALVLAARGRHFAAFALVGLAAAVKFLPLALAPWILVVAARGRPRAQQLRLAAIGAALAVVPSLLSYAAFWHGAETFEGLRARLASGRGHDAGSPLASFGVPLVVYAGLSAWILRGDLARVVRAWVAQSAIVFLFATGMWFPWYLAWPWTAALVLWRGPDRAVSTVLFLGAFLLMIPYAG